MLLGDLAVRLFDLLHDIVVNLRRAAANTSGKASSTKLGLRTYRE
jgi:hypothetical protein